MVLKPSSRFAVLPVSAGRQRVAPVGGLEMGFRDKLRAAFSGKGLKTTAGAFGAALSILVSAPRPAKAEDPNIMLPSQERHAARVAELSDPNYKPPVLRVITHPAFVGGVGVVAAGGIGYLAYNKMEQKKAEEYRNLLKSKSGVSIDASILDEARVNRPGAKAVEYTNAPKFGSYRPPPEKLMKDVRDKYVWKKTEAASLDGLEDKMQVDLFNKDASKDASGSPTVEVVGANDGPKTSEQKALEDQLKGLSVDQIIDKAIAEPDAMDPKMMAMALPALQAQLSEVLRDGISAEEVAEVKASFREMGIDLQEMFRSVDEMEKSGLADSLGPEGVEFFKTLRKILETPTTK